MSPQEKIAAVLKKIEDKSLISEEQGEVRFDFNDRIVAGGLVFGEDEREILLKLNKEGVVKLIFSDGEEAIRYNFDLRQRLLNSSFTKIEILNTFYKYKKKYKSAVEPIRTESSGVVNYLTQHGFKSSINGTPLVLSRPQDIYDFHHRIKFKNDNIENYGTYFELLVKEIMVREFNFEAERGISILKEGPGGDFDVLALNTSRELVYIECKTGKSVSFNEMKEFFNRHKFLKPSLSVMVIDQSKRDVKESLFQMRAVLTDWAKQHDKTLKVDYQYPDFKMIPEEEEFAYHMNRNIFFCSGEGIFRGLSHCFRYYSGVVKQTAYWGSGSWD
jgi:hypothetical protein